MTTASECEAIVRRVFEVLHGGRARAAELPQLVGDRAELRVMATGERGHGPDAFLADAERWSTAMPHMQWELVELIAAEDRVAVEVRLSGIHTGPLRLPREEIAATGRPMEVRSSSFFRLDGGKIVSRHDYSDLLSVLSQLQRSSAGLEEMRVPS